MASPEQNTEASAPALTPDTQCHGPALEFDFPGMKIGVAEYAEGPTGVTVFHFPERAKAAVDVRGGLPGTYNVDILRLGYDVRNLDAICISGGSWYGLQAASGVAHALKEDALRSGDLANLANVAGAIIYDYGDRRLNEVCPDVHLGAAALRSAQPGRFPLGAHGAGRMAMQGVYFGLGLHSGQGAAFRQWGKVKIAAFVVANPVGLLVDRKAQVQAGGQALPEGMAGIEAWLSALPLEREVTGMVKSPAGQSAQRVNPANTTISVVVTNARMPFADLQRMGIQVHASMGRGIQPFATAWDGDVLFTASTDEVDIEGVSAFDLGTLASELMWDALLTTTTPRPSAPKEPASREAVQGVEGLFKFDRNSMVFARVNGDGVEFEVVGQRPVYGMPCGHRFHARLQNTGLFSMEKPGNFGLLGGRFEAGPGGVVDRLVFNPGAWEQTGLLQRTPSP